MTWRILIAIITFLGRFFFQYRYKLQSRGKLKESDGTPYYIATSKSGQKGNRVYKTIFRFEFESPFVFKLKKRSLWDTFFAQIKISTPFKTSDADFDEKVYIGSDHSFLNLKIKNELQLREMILFFAESDYTIQGDGKTLSFLFWGDKSQDQDLARRCTAFLHALAALKNENETLSPQSLDVFDTKVKILVSLIWGLFAYAATFILSSDTLQPNYFRPGDIKLQASCLGLFAAVLLYILIIRRYRRSTRGNIFVVECSLLVFISFPIIGYEIIEKINYQQERSSPAIEFNTVVTDIYEAKSRSRNTNYKTYHLWMKKAPGLDRYRVPTYLSINSRAFEALRKGSFIRINFSEGNLGHSYLNNIQRLSY